MKTYEWQPTKENPGRWAWLLYDIAEIEQVQSTKTLHFSNIEKARNAKIKFPDMIFTIDGKQMKCIKCEIKTGGIKTLLFGHFEVPVSEYTTGISVIVRKQLSDYETRPNGAGKYKNCEGGGWYSMANLYELNGKYYTDAY